MDKGARVKWRFTFLFFLQQENTTHKQHNHPKQLKEKHRGNTLSEPPYKASRHPFVPTTSQADYNFIA